MGGSSLDNFGKTNLYGMWFGTKENIINHYSEDEETEISSYNIPENSLIISDLGEEGVLFAFEENPINLFVKREVVST